MYAAARIEGGKGAKIRPFRVLGRPGGKAAKYEARGNCRNLREGVQAEL